MIVAIVEVGSNSRDVTAHKQRRAARSLQTSELRSGGICEVALGDILRRVIGVGFTKR